MQIGGQYTACFKVPLSMGTPHSWLCGPTCLQNEEAGMWHATQVWSRSSRFFLRENQKSKYFLCAYMCLLCLLRCSALREVKSDWVNWVIDGISVGMKAKWKKCRCKKGRENVFFMRVYMHVFSSSQIWPCATSMPLNFDSPSFACLHNYSLSDLLFPKRSAFLYHLGQRSWLSRMTLLILSVQGKSGNQR